MLQVQCSTLKEKNMNPFKIIETEEKHLFLYAGIKHHDGSYKIRLICYHQGNRIGHIDLTPSNLVQDIKKLANWIPKFNNLKTKDNILFSQALYDKLVNSEFDVYEPIRTLGWQHEKNHYCCYAGTQLLGHRGETLFNELATGFPKANNIQCDYPNILNNWMRNNAKRQAVLALSLAAPLAGLMQKNILVALVGNSSSGKTVAAKLATSLFQSPNYERTNLTFRETENTLRKRLHGNEGLPVLIDDISLCCTSNYHSIICSLANDTSNNWLLNRQSEMVQHWHTTIFLTSEKSLLDSSCKKYNATLGRLIEIPISVNDLFDNSEQARTIKQFYESCNGVMGNNFVRYVIKNHRKNIHNLYAKWIQELQGKNTDKNQILSRQIENIALVGVAAEIAAEIGLEFDSKQITDCLFNCSIDAIDNQEMAQKSAKDIVEEGIQKILQENSPEIYSGQKGVFLPISSKTWKTFVEKSGLGVHEIHRIRRELGYDDATASINNKLYRGFYLDKEVK